MHNYGINMKLQMNMELLNKKWHSLKLGPETENHGTRGARSGILRPGTLKPKILGSKTKLLAMKASLPNKYASHINSPLYHQI